MSFSFGFAGADIDAGPGDAAHETQQRQQQQQQQQQQQVPARRADGQAGAFPVPRRRQLAAERHGLRAMLSGLPSRIAYDTLDVTLDDGQVVALPRRELWDVRVQLMAEDDGGRDGDGDGDGLRDGLGDRDVKTGVYEGGFKSWESSVDLVKVLATHSHPASWACKSARIIELGCGTALPSLAMFRWIMALEPLPDRRQVSFILADYNPSVLQLVTLPNLILTWALYHRQRIPVLQDAFSLPGELELTPIVLETFETYLSTHGIQLSFLSGGWSPDFVQLLYQEPGPCNDDSSASEASPVTMLLGAETIYSPFALQAFAEMVLSVLHREKSMFSAHASAWIAAKRLYFGVGGSLDDFVDRIEARGVTVSTVREETDGVRRGVVRCVLPQPT
ncbi:uncharacterized protein UV8b_04559 [Ustilaginoidea virens]|uniref:protein-histidine N-methyltransferase n=1 Tax=Ustilaginoidea virens TaxID=1159556 RepID=A0A8E5HS08_USTVR|nr:uncharacterized protein UV8b_04559 [Ustilaginoidea virens]QUC20318.1 hypothetical protein UV8b_04559 [Ustilaginoidea virens]